MRGNIDKQLQYLCEQAGIGVPGESRHEAKEAAKEELCLEGIPATSSNIAAKTSLYSGNTYTDYKDTWHQCVRHASDYMGLKDLAKISSEHVKGFLETRIDADIGYSRFSTECSHLNKLENVFSRTLHDGFNIRSVIAEMREYAKSVLSHETKESGGFENPDAVIQNLSEKSSLAAKIQLEGGARLHEAALIRENQLKDIQPDCITGAKRGVIQVRGKGGKIRDIRVSPATYQRLKSEINKDQKKEFNVGYRKYSSEVHRTAKKVGEIYTGTHDFRYSYAQNRMNDTIDKGYSYEQALQQTSWDMGHERADITEIYLR